MGTGLPALKLPVITVERVMQAEGMPLTRTAMGESSLVTCITSTM